MIRPFRAAIEIVLITGMNVLALASYPLEAAATRYRLHQFVVPLASRGISLHIRPFLNHKLFARLYRPRALPLTALGLLGSLGLRFKDLLAAQRSDVILIQREAMIFGPPIIEWLITHTFKRPMVLDLDDATYVSYTSPTYGRLGSALKWFHKTDDLILWSKLVLCGNREIAAYVTSKGREARVIPTVVDTDIFVPASNKPQDKVVLGWIGTHSTFPYLKSIFPVLQNLARDYQFQLRVIGAGTEVRIPGVEVEYLPWRLEREVHDFQSFDIGLYPIGLGLDSDNWVIGKSGFKAVQYMAVGIPYVATPVGAVNEMGEVGRTHLCASTLSEWQSALAFLIESSERRKIMGEAGRQHAIENYRLSTQADKLAEALRKVAE